MIAKSKILICTIFRSSEKTFPNYWKQLTENISNCPDVDFYYSGYENDSVDNTKNILLNAPWSEYFKDYSIITEDIATKHYGSVKDDTRVQNLAAARTKATRAKNLVSLVDKVLFVESDIFYDPDTFRRLIDFQTTHNLQKVDIVSIALLRHRNDHNFARDGWATRWDEKSEQNNSYKNYQQPYERYWSTFGGVILYDATPFQQGLDWSGWNKRLNKWDCDTAVICEDFRSMGFTDIYIDHRTHAYPENK